jgi:hypothetical protein
MIGRPDSGAISPLQVNGVDEGDGLKREALQKLFSRYAGGRNKEDTRYIYSETHETTQKVQLGA